MTGTQHVYFATYSTILVATGKYIPPIYIDIPQFALGIFWGSLLPDIDEKHSLLGRFSPIPILYKVTKFSWFKHAGITHTILINIIIAGISYYYKSSIGYGVSIGYATHLFADNITGNNLEMLWYPFRRRKRR